MLKKGTYENNNVDRKRGEGGGEREREKEEKNNNEQNIKKQINKQHRRQKIKMLREKSKKI